MQTFTLEVLEKRRAGFGKRDVDNFCINKHVSFSVELARSDEQSKQPHDSQHGVGQDQLGR